MSQQFKKAQQAADFGDVIYQYTREQAIADGVLVDVSNMARDVGIILPVAMTAAAWADAVAWREADNGRQTYQDESGRLWDVLFMAAFAIRTQRREDDRLLYQLRRIPRDGRTTTACVLTLKLMLGPGDDGEPVITILLPNED
jgi:hypothetical protein